MSAYDYPAIVIALSTAIDEKVEVLESTCYSLRADHQVTTIARAQLIQIKAVKDFLNGKTRAL